jgi:hypothetical protein
MKTDDKNNIAYIFGQDSISVGYDSSICAYGKYYTNFDELISDKKLIDENPIALLYVLEKNIKNNDQ